MIMLTGKPGEGMMKIDNDKELLRIKQHIKDHAEEENWGMVIEMAWGMLKRQGCKCLKLK